MTSVRKVWGVDTCVSPRRVDPAVCFSPQADIVGGLVISGIGVDVVRHVHRRRDHMALAALPLVLGAHQLDEAFVWWGQEGHVPSAIGHVALWIYLLIAFVLLPIVVPVAVLHSKRTNGEDS